MRAFNHDVAAVCKGQIMFESILGRSCLIALIKVVQYCTVLRLLQITDGRW